ncbi:putative flavin reductase [uncultured Mycobacterium sp.]|uniref:Putative flavin reductase n=1 Tax=uncultured Mycobacterium sp. TaxID=171292 RepID=A0A1Y5PGA9_9MYCO|nr:putative flavin reductase [uncultured Mycobacterium sp.]
MKFLVLGATGRTGVHFVKNALDQGHQVTALVRRPDATVDPRAHIVSGDVTDAAAIATAARGHDAVISTLGVTSVRQTPALITDTVRAVIASAKTSGVDRFVIVSAFGVGDSLAKASFLAGLIFRTALRKKYEDKAASEVLLKASDLKWTLAYPGALNDRAGGAYTAIALEDVTRLPILPSTSRVNVADFLLRSAVENTFIRQVVVVTNTK